jgi:hypothetical protein
MKQETLEEVAENYAKSISSIKPFFRESTKKTFIEGAKRQQEQDKNRYSEEDMKSAWTHGETRSPKEFAHLNNFYEWFEQFSKLKNG